MIADRQFPRVVTNTRLMREGGYFSAEREYLCVFHSDLEFDICAAPFGTSFFVSWFLKERRNAGDEFLSRLWLVGWLFRPAPKTYYQIDAALMFSRSIDSIVRAAIAKMASDRGFTQETAQ